MGYWQRIYADLESGAASIREYHPGLVPGLMQLPEYTWSPPEVVFDEIGLRRFNFPADVMARQLRHVVALTRRHPQVTARISPISTGRVRSLLPM